METIKVIIDNLKDNLLFKIICTNFSSLVLRNETIIVNIFVNFLLQILLFCLSITSNIKTLSYVSSKKVSTFHTILSFINATINMYKNDHIKMYKINST